VAGSGSFKNSAAFFHPSMVFGKESGVKPTGTVPTTGGRLVILSANNALGELSSYEGERYISGMYSTPELSGLLLLQEEITNEKQTPAPSSAAVISFFPGIIFTFIMLFFENIVMRELF